LKLRLIKIRGKYSNKTGGICKARLGRGNQTPELNDWDCKYRRREELAERGGKKDSETGGKGLRGGGGQEQQKRLMKGK